MKTTSITEAIHKLAKDELSPSRYAHSRRVIALMQKLNRRLFLGIDDEIIQITGWAHDLTKEWQEEDLLRAIHQYKREKYLSTHPLPPLWHALTAMPYISEKLHYDNREIDQAIIHHPTADPNAKTLSKLLFIADENEEGRSHLTFKHHLMLQHASLDQLYHFSISNLRLFLLQKNQEILRLTLESYQVEKERMQKKVQAFHQNPFKENTYLFLMQDTLLIIDPGVKVEQIAPIILASNPANVKILYTHGHFDHIIFGADLEHFLQVNQIPFSSYASKEELFYFSEDGVKHIQDVITMYGINDFYSCSATPQIDHFLADGEGIECNDFIFHHTPGHTKGSGLFYSAKENIAFTGDTIFANGSIGRTDFPDSSPQAMEDSLKKIFTLLPPHTLIYPGHAMPSTIEKEEKIHRNLF